MLVKEDSKTSDKIIEFLRTRQDSMATYMDVYNAVGYRETVKGYEESFKAYGNDLRFLKKEGKIKTWISPTTDVYWVQLTGKQTSSK